MRIFIGTAEIAGMVHFLASAFRRCGNQVTTCVDNFGSGFFDYNYDIVINSPRPHHTSTNPLLRKARALFNNAAIYKRRMQVFEHEKDKHDLFIFIWNGFLVNGLRDYQLLKRNGKKIVSIFLGSDVRHVSAFAQEFGLDVRTWERWFHTADLNQQLFRLRKAELYSDAVYSVPDQAGLAIRPYNKIYIPFDLSLFRFNVPARTIPRIVHIPSRTGIKGTAFIVQVMEELKSEGNEFDFQVITGIPNREVHEVLFDADILVDEIYLHGPGTLSLEGVASGCAVAVKTIRGEAYDSLLCNINFENAKEKIRRLIRDVEYRVQLSHISLEGIRLLNDPVRIANDIVEQGFECRGLALADYHPRFFSDSYMLPPGTKLNRRNILLTRNVVKKFGLETDLNINRMKSARLI